MWVSIGRIIILLFLVNTAFAQYFPMHTQVTNNLQLNNPAYAGFSGKLNGFLMSRHQWVGMEGEPNTQFLYLNGAPKDRNMGWGLGIMNDQIGYLNFSQVSASYSYRIKLGIGQLSMGLQGGFLNQRIDPTLLNLDNTVDDSFDEQNLNLWRPQFGFGFYYESRKLALGVAVPWLLKGSTLSFQTEQHIFGNAAYLLSIAENIKFKPAIQAKVLPGATWQVDLVGNFIMWNRLWLTGGVRRGEGYFTGMRIKAAKSIWAGYSYDRMIGTLRGVSGYNTHEIFISFNIEHKNLNHRSPRYF
ncbi:MAG: PorP/SprF family type IX secretion system membrane protein [Bacteroidia bacterium]